MAFCTNKSIVGQSNFFWKNASNSMGNLGPKGECIPIFIEFGQCLTTCPKLQRSLVWLEFAVSGDIRRLIHVVKQLRKWLKIGVQSGFGPKFTVEFEAFFQKNWTGLKSNLNLAKRKVNKLLSCYFGRTFKLKMRI